jgi:hypothetical protein
MCELRHITPSFKVKISRVRDKAGEKSVFGAGFAKIPAWEVGNSRPDGTSSRRISRVAQHENALKKIFSEYLHKAL